MSLEIASESLRSKLSHSLDNRLRESFMFRLKSLVGLIVKAISDLN